MQLGHYAVVLVLSSYAPELTGGRLDAFSVESMAVALAATQLPNLDVVPIWLKLAKPSFHCTWSHTLLFAVAVGLILLPFNVGWAMLAFITSLVHLLSDMPSSVGLPLFMPFTKKRFTLNLWADTGFWGWETTKGTYLQAWTWILEGGSYLFLFIRAYQVGVWPFV